MSTYVQTFIRVVNEIQNRGIQWSKHQLKSVPYWEEAKPFIDKYLGSDQDFIQTDVDLRRYVQEMWEDEKHLFTSIFVSALDGVKITHERMLIFLAKIRAEKLPYEDIAKGLLYYVAVKQIMEEFKAINSVINKGLIYPRFVMRPQFFMWKRCNYILRKYALYFSVPEGYDGYYYEKGNIALISYLVSKGFSLEDADKMVKNHEGGLFIPYLETWQENMLAPTIFTGETGNVDAGIEGVSEAVFCGLYGAELIKDIRYFNTTYPNGGYDLYTENVKPIMIELTGMFMHNVLEELSKSDALGKKDAYIYHVSPYRFGLAVKKGVDIKEILPTYYRYMKPVLAPSLNSVVIGEQL